MTSKTFELDFHSQRYTDFHLLRIANAVGQKYTQPVTAYLVNVQVIAGSIIGVVFGHSNPGPHGRFSDGHFLRTSDLRFIRKEGRFWVATTLNSRYVLASFRKDGGRNGLREFQRALGGGHYLAPKVLH